MRELAAEVHAAAAAAAATEEEPPQQPEQPEQPEQPSQEPEPEEPSQEPEPEEPPEEKPRFVEVCKDSRCCRGYVPEAAAAAMRDVVAGYEPEVHSHTAAFRTEVAADGTKTGRRGGPLKSRPKKVYGRPNAAGKTGKNKCLINARPTAA